MAAILKTEKSCNISNTVWLILMKFEMLIHFGLLNLWARKKNQNSKIEDGRKPSFENENRHLPSFKFPENVEWKILKLVIKQQI